MDKTTQNPARKSLMSWGALLGLALMTMQAPASTLITGQLAAGTQRGAVHELVEKLGYTESGPCTVVSLNEEDKEFIKEGFFRAECDGTKLFLKFDDVPAAQAFVSTLPLLESSPLLSTSVLKPIAEFSFRREGRRRNTEEYCSAYPWIAGDTLQDVMRKVHQPEQETAYLTDLYRQLGEIIGEMHAIGLVDADQPLQDMQTRLLHKDMHSRNVKITPDNRIAIIDIDSFTAPEQPQPVLAFAVDNFNALVLLADREGFLFSSPTNDAWLPVLPGFGEAMLTAYCQTLVGQDEAAACVSQIAEKVAERVETAHKSVTEYITTAMAKVKEGEEPPLDKKQVDAFVNEQEMYRRLDMVLGPLR
ncbi:MAG: hypothetical protein OXC07_02140 [Kistimonas sp.]|nr:hypothetical protein [Kistimonas sp.]